MASDGCLSAEGQEGEISSFGSASSYIQTFLQKGSLPRWDVRGLGSSPPSGQLHCSQRNALSSSPTSLPLCSCSKDKFFTTEDVITRKKSVSQLKLVTSVPNEGLSHHLLHACSHGLSNAVQLIVTTEPELNLDAPLSCGDTNDQELTPLAVAAFSNALLVCELLIKAGAGVNSTDALQRSPLHWAVLGKHLSTVRLLLKQGASTELVDQKGFTPLMYACILKSNDIVTALLKESPAASHGVDVPRSECGTTPLMIACLQGSPDVVKLLLKHGAQVSLANEQGLTPLHHGVWGGDVKCVKQVLSRGGRTVLTQRDGWGRTPLLIAAAKGDVNMCQFLLKKGAWLADVDEGGRTVLHWATLSQQPSCLEFLLNYSTSAGGGQALIHQTDNEGATPTHYATVTTNDDILGLLLEKGAPPGLRDHSGYSPMVWAAVCGNVAAVERLLSVNDGGAPSDEQDEKATHQESVDLDTSQKKGVVEPTQSGEGVNNDRGTPSEKPEKEEADATTQNEVANDGGTPSEEQQETTGEEATPDDEKDLSGATSTDEEIEEQEKGGVEREEVLQPLHAAASVGSEGVCTTLINAGAKVNSMSPAGLTPLHYASRFGHTACAKLLLEHGGIVDATTPQQETGLHLACRYGHGGVANHLLEHHAQIDRPLPPLGDCPVHLTSTNGHDGVLEVLIRHGCNVDEKRPSDHQTALHLAACSGHLGCCEALVGQGCGTGVTLPTLEKLTALDVALLNGHRDCADFLVSCHAPTGGGAYHRAACTIQAVWRFYRHKCRMATARQWCASVIQRAVRHWLGQRRAKRLRDARERARHRAAATIQYHWKLYVAQKRRYESTYAKLKARLERERVAAELIVTELQYQRHSVELPTAAPMKLKSLTTANQSSPTNPRYLLRATANPVSLFPSGSLVFPAKPQRPLLRRIPNIRVATKPNSNCQQVPSTTSAATGEIMRKDSTSTTPIQVNANAGNTTHLPPIPTNSSLTAGSLSNTNDRVVPVSSEMESKGDHTNNIKLPALRGNGSLVAIAQHSNRDEEAGAVGEPGSSQSQEALTKPRRLTKNEATASLASHEATAKLQGSSSHESALKPGRGKNPRPIRNSSSNDQLSSSPKYPPVDNTVMRKTASPVKLQSQMRVTRHSTFKDTPLGYKPAAVRNQRVNTIGDHTNSRNYTVDQDTRGTTIKFTDSVLPEANREQHGLLTDAQTKNSSSTEQLNVVDNSQGGGTISSSHSPHSPGLDEHLYQQAPRYDKLNQVLALLQQAKDGESRDGSEERSEPPGTPVKISELKSHIKTALDEAVRLRADTEALQQRIITTVTDTGAHQADTVASIATVNS